MKIYFAGSIKGGRQDADLYKLIIDHLKTKGDVLTEHLGKASISTAGEVDKTPKFIHDRDINWLRQSDIVIAEVTTPSLGIGYEIGIATSLNKRIICLFRGEEIKISNMIRGNDKLQVIQYSGIDEVRSILDKIL